MVDFIYDKLKQTNDLKVIIKELLEDIISPDYVKTSKTYLLFVTILFIDGVGCDNMTCIIILIKQDQRRSWTNW